MAIPILAVSIETDLGNHLASYRLSYLRTKYTYVYIYIERERERERERSATLI
jgi:hypothetical protein